MEDVIVKRFVAQYASGGFGMGRVLCEGSARQRVLGENLVQVVVGVFNR
jgi:hypothetical protein